MDYIELVSKETCITEIDPEKTDLTYSFYDLEAGNADGVLSGICYSPEQGIDKRFSEDSDRITYSCALVGIPQEYADSDFSVSAYVKYISGENEYVMYSNPTISSLGQTLDKLVGTSQYEKALEALGFSF